jgi:hypothetical protein
MPRGGSRPGERRGGRQKGVPNRRTTEAALLAERAVIEAAASGKQLAREILREFMCEFAAEARANRTKKRLFEKWSRLACEQAARLAPYESPRFRPIEQTLPLLKPIEEPLRFTLRVFDGGHEVEHMGTRRIGGTNGAEHPITGADEEGGDQSGG